MIVTSNSITNVGSKPDSELQLIHKSCFENRKGIPYAFTSGIVEP